MRTGPQARTCHRCGDYFQAVRRDAKYCSAACRQAAHTGRPMPDPDRICDWCMAPIGHMRSDARYCSDQCRARSNTPLKPDDVDHLAAVIAGE